jgi:hypothetical protein
LLKNFNRSKTKTKGPTFEEKINEKENSQKKEEIIKLKNYLMKTKY